MTTTEHDSQLYEDTFKITEYDQGKYDRVARITCVSLDGETQIDLDINIELFPCTTNDELQLMLATSLVPGGGKDEGTGWREQTRAGPPAPSLADNFDYVCRGKIYKFVEEEEKKSSGDARDGHKDKESDHLNIVAYVSFGGLLMRIDGPYRKLTTLRVEYVYLLLRK